ncbi:RNA polymerase subunit sigma-28 [Kribbella sp. ALI-6-A]|uniref:sigma-70 family RNA polymerase sigma factor n=1 Tax=Kribbella sp. ALI-6-A TaxID=1933817 RepID=UPI00097CA627|nr:sigma-70 family RNA polymerase sigma factor [Kribbella sp. ALI-6-A]ONI67000.1 RNA polymerase subunit sigma-28 [Kribbella sp. ALI-6-A]
MTIAPVQPAGTKQQIADQTQELLERAAGLPEPQRQDLLDQVVLLNAPIARSIASRYRRKGVDADDLEQVACLGLVKAANGYRPDESSTFLAYAVPTIRGELKRYFRDCAWTVRPPRRVQEMQGTIAAAEPELTQKLGHLPSDRETAEALGTAPDEVAEAMSVRNCFSTLSLDAPGSADGGVTLMETVADAEQGYELVENVHTLTPVVSDLDDRERRILELRFCNGFTQEEIGNELGVSQMQVSRLLRGILERLRAELSAPQPQG